MAHVLIGFAEALPAPEVFFSLHHAGHRVSAIHRAGRRPALVRHLPLAGAHAVPVPEEDAEAAASALAGLMQGPGAPDLFLPIDDAALWLANRALAERPERIAGASGAAAAAALDKNRQVAAAREAGLRVPETRQVTDAAEAGPPPPLPGIAKPALAVTARGGRLEKGGALYIEAPGDMERLAAALAARQGPFLLQPLIAGIGEGLFGFAGPGGVSHWSAHRRLRMMNPHGSGSSACAAIPPDPALRAAAGRFLAAIGWRGPFMIELLRDAEGRAWFMELNGRLWGSLALARAQGLEYPAWAVAAADDPDFVPPEVAPPAPALEARHLGRDLLHLLFVARGPKSAFHRAGWPALGPALRAVLAPQRGRRLYNADPAFPGFARAEAWETIRSALGRRR